MDVNTRCWILGTVRVRFFSCIPTQVQGDKYPEQALPRVGWCRCRYEKHVKATEEAHRHTPEMGMVEKAGVNETKMSKERIHKIMPNEQVGSNPWPKSTASLSMTRQGSHKLMLFMDHYSKCKLH